MLVDSKKIEKFRVRARLSLPALSKKSGISRSQVYYIEKHGRTTEERAGKLADALGVTIDDLLPDQSIGTVREGIKASAAFGATVIHEPPSPIYLTLERSRRAGLDSVEIKALEDTLERVIDLLTIEDPRERKKYATLIGGMIELCHKQLPHTEKEKDEAVAK